MNENEKILYHYTSLEGLLGIIESKSIWATNILYLNDASEINYSKKLLIDQIYTFNNEIQMDNKSIYKLRFIDRLIENINEHIIDKEHSEFFVCSFSEEKDLLSQWRGYCSDDIGFNLGFSLRKIKEINKFNESSLKKCIYDEKRQISNVRKLIDSIFLQYDATSFEKDREGQEFILFVDLYIDFLELAPTFKHPKFKEEKEWRIIKSLNPKKGSELLKFRSGQSMIVPYIEIALPKEGDNLIIDKIVVGPTSEPKLSKASVEMLLKSNKVKFGEVQYSTIPYRNW